ncbi:hypothetical protein [Neorhizobium sp. NCHU2750]|uniref:hypothetical protein n=1 Tax=Neorhizobium sp. NCHU2750 TaxID=1825976 RepID=UPI000EB69732|nr:hypothetical protein NCHU2750_23320 [Neorhizobium sp. NCHU2750]
MTSYSVETLIYDLKARQEFFDGYDKMIKWGKDNGFVKSALEHQRNRKRIWDEITMLD